MPKARLVAAVDQHALLPQCLGPKLHRFQQGATSLKFISLLSDQASEGDAHVFQVSYGSEVYALKMFKFYDPAEDREGLGEDENPLFSDQQLADHLDPFYAECRAYGRIVEEQCNGKVAVYCYGFTSLPALWEAKLAEQFAVADWNRPSEEYLKHTSQRQPFRAVVKELVLANNRFTEPRLKRILRDLKRLRKMGVYPMDVRANNYKDGLLIDFSVAYTEPHLMFKLRPYDIKILKLQDLFGFQNMIDAENISTWLRSVRNRDYCEKLRSRKKGRPGD